MVLSCQGCRCGGGRTNVPNAWEELGGGAANLASGAPVPLHEPGKQSPYMCGGRLSVLFPEDHAIRDRQKQHCLYFPYNRRPVCHVGHQATAFNVTVVSRRLGLQSESSVDS